MKRNLIAHYQGGGSDKVYIASIRQQANGSYAVVAKWGRRHGSMQLQVKGNYGTLGNAESAMQALFREKLNKGYKNIEDSAYNGPVTVNSVSQNLEVEPGGIATGKPVVADDDDPINAAAANSTLVNAPTPEPVKTRVGTGLRVVCVNNLGIEDRFEQDAEYEAKTCKNTEMLVVTDMNGNKDEYFADRFRKIA